MKRQYSPLRQERERRGWTRAYVEAITECRITAPSLERWEEGKSWPRYENITAMCRLYGRTQQELGLDRSAIMDSQKINIAPQKEEDTQMSEFIRRAVFSNLGSRLASLIDTWPKRDYRYEELQGELSKAIFDHRILTTQDGVAEISRRETLKSVALTPILLIGGSALIPAGRMKTDTDLLLKRCAAGITACRYFRRSNDVHFASDLASSYISLLQPLIYSHSNAHRKAAAGLLAQCLTFKSKLVYSLNDDDQESIALEAEAIRYAKLAENGTEQVIANREMALYHWWSKRYGQALPYAEAAYGLARNTPRIIRSFAASGLAFCQASSGHTEDAKISLKEAHNLFDPTTLILFMPYDEVILSSSGASVYQHTGDFKEAAHLCKKILTSSDLSLIGGIHERIKYARIEVSRDDHPRDMNLCISLLTEAVTGAKELGSKRYIREAREVHDMLRLVWPREDAVKTLGEQLL